MGEDTFRSLEIQSSRPGTGQARSNKFTTRGGKPSSRKPGRLDKLQLVPAVVLATAFAFLTRGELVFH